MNDAADEKAAESGGPKFKAHPGLPTPAGAAASPGTSSYQGGEYLTEEDWRARRRPERVEGIVDRLMANVSGGRAAPAALLSTRWPEVVGDAFADKTRPGSCRSGRLVILVVDGATASKMRFGTAQILQKAAEIAGEGQVSSVAFRVSPGLQL